MAVTPIPTKTISIISNNNTIGQTTPIITSGNTTPPKDLNTWFTYKDNPDKTATKNTNGQSQIWMGSFIPSSSSVPKILLDSLKYQGLSNNCKLIFDAIKNEYNIYLINCNFYSTQQVVFRTEDWNDFYLANYQVRYQTFETVVRTPQLVSVIAFDGRIATTFPVDTIYQVPDLDYWYVDLTYKIFGNSKQFYLNLGDRELKDVSSLVDFTFGIVKIRLTNAEIKKVLKVKLQTINAIGYYNPYVYYSSTWLYFAVVPTNKFVMTLTPTCTPTITPTTSITPTISPTNSPSPSATSSYVPLSRTPTPTISITPSLLASPTPTPTHTPTNTPTPSITPTTTRTPTLTPSQTKKVIFNYKNPTPTPTRKIKPTPFIGKIKTDIEFSSKDGIISPMIDKECLSYTLVHNIINVMEHPESELEATGGEAWCRYIVKPVALNSDMMAQGLFISFAACLPPYSKVRLYYRTLNTVEDLEQNIYIKKWREIGTTGTVETNYSIFEFQDFEFNLETIDYDSDPAIKEFNVFSIKIVMESDNPAKVPLVKDFRVIALL